MYMSISFEYSINPFDFIIDITSFKRNLPEDIEYDIYITGKENGKNKLLLLPDWCDLYSDQIIYEKAIDCAQKYYYEQDRGM